MKKPKLIKGYKIVSPLSFNNIIVENKSQANRLKRLLKTKEKLKLKRYSWRR